MKRRGALPFVPAGRGETLRREMVSLLREDEPQSAREISQRLGIRESEVLTHLEHVRLAFRNSLVVSPASCMKCGFVFSKRDRLKGPGRCPVCRDEHIAEPRFSLR
ncbi:ArsR family transcriptional regulator [Geomonas sp. RF6]|uniref:ArsR family transcriptional regulator n=1 Tax=Geomonas sp. RF6 TaxID=2897342 RepID=UPI001E5F711E|nr:ArsR family transcriptional regulator [Geomonas sp. RF6]UFS69052.1 ArsR family transcriptional regulator [Geomonas sp. RF6]